MNYVLLCFNLHLFYLSRQIALTGYFFVILSLTEIYNSFFWYHCHMLPAELWEPSCKSSSLPVDPKKKQKKTKQNNKQKGQSRDNNREYNFII